MRTPSRSKPAQRRLVEIGRHPHDLAGPQQKLDRPRRALRSRRSEDNRHERRRPRRGLLCSRAPTQMPAPPLQTLRLEALLRAELFDRKAARLPTAQPLSPLFRRYLRHEPRFTIDGFRWAGWGLPGGYLLRGPGRLRPRLLRIHREAHKQSGLDLFRGFGGYHRVALLTRAAGWRADALAAPLLAQLSRVPPRRSDRRGRMARPAPGHRYAGPCKRAKHCRVPLNARRPRVKRGIFPCQPCSRANLATRTNNATAHSRGISR